MNKGQEYYALVYFCNLSDRNVQHTNPLEVVWAKAIRDDPGEVTAFQLTGKTCGGRYHYFDYCLDTWPTIVPNLEDLI